jgi:hypothetical protein
MKDEDEKTPPLFTMPSGQELDSTLLSLMTGAARVVNRQKVVAMALVVIDSEGGASNARVVTHPLAYDMLTARLRQAADILAAEARAVSAPVSNSSALVH